MNIEPSNYDSSRTLQILHADLTETNDSCDTMEAKRRQRMAKKHL